MFNYPIFEMFFIVQRVLMAINAIIHNFVSYGKTFDGSVILAVIAHSNLKKETSWIL